MHLEVQDNRLFVRSQTVAEDTDLCLAVGELRASGVVCGRDSFPLQWQVGSDSVRSMLTVTLPVPVVGEEYQLVCSSCRRGGLDSIPSDEMAATLESRVSRKLTEGWCLHGPPFVAFGDLYQAMTRTALLSPTASSS